MPTLNNDKAINYRVYNGIGLVQRQMLETLELIDSVCKDNGITYFLDGGSAIGALRHHGFIPWDDDLDISLLKPDYLKLVSALEKLDNEKYLLKGPSLSNHASSFFGIKTNQFILFKGRVSKKLLPIRVDIRPMNIIINSQETIHENSIYRNIANFLIFGKCDEQYKAEAFDVYERKFGMRKDKFFDFYNYEYGLVSNENTADMVCVHPYLEFSTYSTYKLEEILPVSYVKFEGDNYPVPNTDILLKDFYGNYMTYPSESERKPEGIGCRYVKRSRWIYSNKTDKQSFIGKIRMGIIASTALKVKE